MRTWSESPDRSGHGNTVLPDSDRRRGLRREAVIHGRVARRGDDRSADREDRCAHESGGRRLPTAEPKGPSSPGRSALRARRVTGNTVCPSAAPSTTLVTETGQPSAAETLRRSRTPFVATRTQPPRSAVRSGHQRIARPPNPLRFQGQQFDDETGLHYNRLRYYDPQLGRFISEDPIALHGGVNTYQYAPNPVAYIDPLGLAKGKCVIYWYNHIGGATGHYTVKTIAGTGSMHTEQKTSGDETWIARVSGITAGEPVNSATFDIPDVGAAQNYQRDSAGSRDESDGAYDVSNNSCMTHVMDVLNAGGADVPARGKRAWAFLNRRGVGPRVN
ncbi:hypothetical protein BFF94_028215 [Burkholderia catarinensis]|nr:hypothetical protein BFF94_028215 [Burkholderia catarinensis]